MTSPHLTDDIRPGPDHTRLTLVGTSGGPPPRAGRRGICTAVSVGGRSYVVDMGRSAVEQLACARIQPSDVEAMFVTHLHSDHIADLYNFFWLNWGWPNGNLPGLEHAVTVYGPGPAPDLPVTSASSGFPAVVCPAQPAPGLAAYFEHMVAATAYDVNIRIRDEGKEPVDSLFDVHEIGGATPGRRHRPFSVMEDDRVRVTATIVNHPPVVPALAYRIDTDEGAVVISGDTTISPAVGELAAGASVLCHEAIDLESLEKRGVRDSILTHLVESHTDSTELGALAEDAGVPILALHHLVPGDTTQVDDATWARKGQLGYSGRVVVGHDLDELRVTR